MDHLHKHKLYRPLFLEAARLVWQNKILLLPALFVSLLINLGMYELMLGDAERLLPKFNWNFILPVISFEGLMLKLSALSLSRTILIFAIVGAFIFGLLLLAAWSFAVMINLIKKAVGNQKITLLEAAKKTFSFVWPILFVALLAKGITYISLNIVAIPTVRLLGAPSLFNYVFYYSAFTLLVASSLLVNVLFYYTILFIVVDKNPLLLAIEKAFLLFKKHWLVTLEFGLLLFLINLLALLAFGVFLSLMSLPMIIFLIFSALAKSNLILLLSVIIFGAALIIGLILATAYLVAFYITSWTLLFLKLDESFHSKLHRLFHPFAFLRRKLFSR